MADFTPAVPAGASPITKTAQGLNVPDRPVIPFIEGDGTGPDIWRASVRVLDAAGFDVVLVETVGVGQSEVAVAGSADTTLVLLAPGMGDGIQAAKAGILEIGDVFVVNKADRDGADSTVRDLRHMLQMGEGTGAHRWRRKVVRASAMNGTGVGRTSK